MESTPLYCYITYPVEISALESLPFPFLPQTEKEAATPLPAYPKGFMPEWFQSGSFPEDDLT